MANDSRSTRLVTKALPALVTAIIATIATAAALAAGASGSDPPPAPATQLNWPVSSLTLGGSLDLTLGVDRQSAHPGERLTYDATVTNPGADLRLTGTISATNQATVPAIVSSYFAYVEYLSTDTHKWTPLAGLAAALPGYRVAQTPPVTAGLDLTMAPEPVLGTTVAAGATAAWTHAARVALSPDQLALIRDPARSKQIRLVHRVELTTPIPPAGGDTKIAGETVKTMFTKLLLGQTGELRDVELTVTPDGLTPVVLTKADDPRLANLAPGVSVTVTVTAEIPAVVAKGPGESDAIYLARLRAVRDLAFGATATAKATSGGGASFVAAPGSDPNALKDDDLLVQSEPDQAIGSPQGHVETTRLIPVLTLDKTGPATVSAGQPATYQFALTNEGSSEATPLLEDQVAGQPGEPVTGVPAALALAESALSTHSYNVPDDHPGGDLTDTATLTWRDPLGASYGPISDSLTTQVIAQQASVPEAPPLGPSGFTPLSDQVKFLYTGDDPIQTGVIASKLEPRRTAVIRGNVRTRDNQPLPGVKITIAGHPEYGETTSRRDGGIYMAVNGGGPLTVRYERTGYLAAERTISVPWQDYAFVDDVVLIPLDPAVTQIDLSNPFGPAQVARGSAVADIDGPRQATLLFKPGTQATMQLPSGSIMALTSLNVRATEYTLGDNGPEAMPAALPPTSGYTYAVDLTVDEALAAGAKHVRFDRPVISYTENFLGFPVGGTVPSGYYDRDKSAWLPSDNGRVIKVLAAADGKAVLDVRGTGTPAGAGDLTMLGIDDTELAELATLYAPGESLWRVPVTHFSPYDLNWPFEPPPGAVAPNGGGYGGDQDCSSKQKSSIIECESQTLGEDVDVAGTPYTLNYRSNRVKGRVADRTLEIALTDSSVPVDAIDVRLEVSVAGTKFAKIFPPDPDQTYSFTWNGLDAFGRMMRGSAPVDVRVGYTYPLAYRGSSPSPWSFAESGADTITTEVAPGGDRSLITLWQHRREAVGAWDARGSGLGGWTLDVHHAYDPAGRTLYLGDGSRRSAQSVGAMIKTVAYVDGAFSVEAADGGGYYYASEKSYDGRITRVGADGTVLWATPKDSSLQPIDLAEAPGGSVYVLANESAGAGTAPVPKIYRYWPDGSSRLIAGTPGGSAADGIPASGANIAPPRPASTSRATGIDVASDGTIYIANTNGNTIRKINPLGIITTIAGDGLPGDNGDGGLAARARVNTPEDVALAADGSLFVVDTGSKKIRRIAVDGVISTVAGNGDWGPGGDGGPATGAGIGVPSSVAFAPDGGYYIADRSDRVVRHVRTDGIISQMAGSGFRISTGDGGPPIKAGMSPQRLSVGPDAALYVSDNQLYTGGRIRRIAHSLPGVAADDITVASADGSEFYQFDATGRHLKTFNTHTGALLYGFRYDDAGRLSAVTDGDGDVTTIERDADGAPTQIAAPMGQVMTLGTTPAVPLHDEPAGTDGLGGFLSRVTDPAGNTFSMTYGPGGLLTTFTTPGAAAATFTYDELGLLVRDSSAVGGSKTLARFRFDGSPSFALRFREVSVTTGMGRRSTYRDERLSAGGNARTVTDAAGLKTVSRRLPDGSVTIADPSGSVMTAWTTSDPRFGPQVPLVERMRLGSPGGRVMDVTAHRQVSQSSPGNPLSLTSQTDTLTVNGRASTTTLERDPSGYSAPIPPALASLMPVAPTTRITRRAPSGRVSVSETDDLGRPLMTKTAGIDPESIAYDSHGRPTDVIQGSRASSYSYDSAGRLASATDPIGRTTTYGYDPAGHLTYQAIPDGRVISYTYDQNGNLTSVTPPSRPAHSFAYDAVDRPTAYTPPNLPTGPAPTRYSYNLDGDPTQVAGPDGANVDFNYDVAGRMDALNTPDASVAYTYDPTTGNLRSTATDRPSGPREQIAYSYDGSLPTENTFSGTTNGSVSRTYDNDLRVASTSVNGASTVDYAYDSDNLLIRAGDLTLSRDPGNGLVTGSALDASSTTLTHNAFAEPTSSTALFTGSELLKTLYTRDAIGRITTKTEISPAGTDTYTYTYDQAGRLTGVEKNGSAISSSTYDQNGNRLAHMDASGLPRAATYDTQDRMLAYGENNYSYTDAGELRQKTDTTTGKTTGYAYDTLGSLTAVTLENGSRVDYAIDPRGRRIAKKVDGALIQGFLYGGDQLGPVAELGTDGSLTSRFVYATRENVPDYMIRGGSTYRIVTDHLGSPRLVVNTTNGEIAQQLEYDPFGVVTRDTNPGFQPFGFAGGLYDRETGLVRFGARDYDPETGRFTAKDPILFASLDTNLYGYVLGDPVNVVDPSGLYGFDAFLNDASNFAAGFGDTVSFGVTRKIRRKLGVDDVVNYCSGWYTGGGYTGEGVLTALNIGGGVAGYEFRAAARGHQFRIAPWGNRGSTDWYKQAPHYHHGAPKLPNGTRPDGEGIGRHLPWEGGVW